LHFYVITFPPGKWLPDMKNWHSYALGVLTEIGFTCVLALAGLMISMLNR